LPDEPPDIYISGFGPKATELAAEIGDGYITTSPDKDMVSQFKEGSGGKPAQAGFKVCYASTEDEAVDIAHRLWANSGVPGELAQVLPSPKHFEQVSTLVTKEMTRESAVCGPDVERHVDAFAPFADAGFDEVYVANMGPNYEAMLRMYGDKVLPVLRAGAESVKSTETSAVSSSGVRSRAG
jgi:G6PDH family F420-dependent oxidoreductase